VLLQVLDPRGCANDCLCEQFAKMFRVRALRSQWVDARQPANSLDLMEPGFVGLVLNVPRRHLLGIYKTRHW
jgi:hypothetical protein